ncbi:MAG: hypothetical protein OXB92_16325, partial [Acidimicrobiaceae bacterium]|nr:hypothetical protein [Acidimicrobiaceae bacterium]
GLLGRAGLRVVRVVGVVARASAVVMGLLGRAGLRVVRVVGVVARASAVVMGLLGPDNRKRARQAQPNRSIPTGQPEAEPSNRTGQRWPATTPMT